MSACCMNGISRVHITDLLPEKAAALAQDFKENFQNIEIQAVLFEDKEAIAAMLSAADILVNASPAGMDGQGKPDVPLDSLNKSAVVYDLVYKPSETNLLVEVRELGHKASGGLSMLLYQGAESFEIWTGETAPVDVMRKALGY